MSRATEVVAAALAKVVVGGDGGWGGKGEGRRAGAPTVGQVTETHARAYSHALRPRSSRERTRKERPVNEQLNGRGC